MVDRYSYKFDYVIGGDRKLMHKIGKVLLIKDSSIIIRAVLDDLFDKLENIDFYYETSRNRILIIFFLNNLESYQVDMWYETELSTLSIVINTDLKFNDSLLQYLDSNNKMVIKQLTKIDI